LIFNNSFSKKETLSYIALGRYCHHTEKVKIGLSVVSVFFKTGILTFGEKSHFILSIADCNSLYASVEFFVLSNSTDTTHTL
jgi:hypothetical protein